MCEQLRWGINFVHDAQLREERFSVSIYNKIFISELGRKWFSLIEMV